MLSDPIKSAPATLVVQSIASDTRDALALAGGSNGVDLSAKTRAQMRDLFQLSVDGSAYVSVGLENLVGRVGNDALSGQEIASELTNVINERFGDGREFDLSDFIDTAGASTGVTLNLTRDYDQGDANKINLEIDLGKVLAKAKAVGDIVMDPNDGMLSPEELSTALNKWLK